MKRVLLLDADGVLFWNDTFLAMILKALEEWNIAEQDISEAYRSIVESGDIFRSPEEWISTLENENKHWEKIYRNIAQYLCGKYTYNSNDIMEQLLNKAVYYNNCKVYSDVVPFLEKVHNTIDCYILTNAYPSVYQVLNVLGISKYIKRVFSSSDIRMFKPDKEIFYYTLAELCVNQENVIFVDDKPENVITAQEIGMKTVLMNREKKETTLQWVENLDDLFNQYLRK